MGLGKLASIDTVTNEGRKTKTYLIIKVIINIILPRGFTVHALLSLFISMSVITNASDYFVITLIRLIKFAHIHLTFI